jgi:hypothetical protein
MNRAKIKRLARALGIASLGTVVMAEAGWAMITYPALVFVFLGTVVFAAMFTVAYYS